MNDELAAIAGKYEDLVGRLQEKYGIAREEARQQVATFKKTIALLKKSNTRLMQLQKSKQSKKRTRMKRARSGISSGKPARARSGE